MVLRGNVDSILWSLTGCKGSKLCCKIIHSHEFHKNCLYPLKKRMTPQIFKSASNPPDLLFMPNKTLSGPFKTSQEHAGPLMRTASLWLQTSLSTHLD